MIEKLSSVNQGDRLLLRLIEKDEGIPVVIMSTDYTGDHARVDKFNRKLSSVLMRSEEKENYYYVQARRSYGLSWELYKIGGDENDESQE